MRNYPVLAFSILYFFLVGCKNEPLINSKISGERIEINKEIPPDNEIENFIRPYSEHINKTLDSVLAYNPENLNKSDGELNTAIGNLRSEEHTSELQSRENLVCRLLLEKKNKPFMQLPAERQPILVHKRRH